MHDEDQTAGRPTGRILVLDDEAELGRLLTKLFTRYGYAVTAAQTGSEAIRLFKEAADAGTPFDLAILDLTIPRGPGGKEVVRTLNELQPGLVSIAASGISDGMEDDYALHGFTAFIPKPFNILELRKLAENLLKRSP